MQKHQPAPRDLYLSRYPWPHGKKVRVEVQPGTDERTVVWKRLGVDHLASGDVAAFDEFFVLTAPASENQIEAGEVTS